MRLLRFKKVRIGLGLREIENQGLCTRCKVGNERDEVLLVLLICGSQLGMFGRRVNFQSLHLMLKGGELHDDHTQ